MKTVYERGLKAVYIEVEGRDRGVYLRGLARSCRVERTLPHHGSAVLTLGKAMQRAIVAPCGYMSFII